MTPKSTFAAWILAAFAVVSFDTTPVAAHHNSSQNASLVGAISALAALGGKNVNEWSPAFVERFRSERAKIDAYLKDHPDGEASKAWFEGSIFAPSTGASYGWYLYSTAHIVFILESEPLLDMDRASLAAQAIMVPLNVGLMEIDACLPQKILRLQSAIAISSDGLGMYMATHAASEAMRNIQFAENSFRTAILTGSEPSDPRALDLAMLRGDIILAALWSGGLDAALADDIQYLNPRLNFGDRSGVIHATPEQISAAAASIDEDLRQHIEAALPFFARLKTMQDWPPDSVIAELCG